MRIHSDTVILILVLLLTSFVNVTFVGIGHDSISNNKTLSSQLTAISSRYDLYENSTWYIGNDTVFEGKSVYLRSSLIVNASCNLTLINTTIILDVGSKGAFGIDMAQGSSLSMSNSSISSLTSHKFGFRALNASISLNASSMKGCGGAGGPKGSNGLEMTRGNLTMIGSNITFGDYGIFANGTTIRLTGSEIMSNGNDGIHTNGSDIGLLNCTISSNTNNGVFVQYGRLSVSGCKVSDNWQIGIWSQFANVSIEQTTFLNQVLDMKIEHLVGVRVSDPSSLTIQGVNVSVRDPQGTEVYNGTTGSDGKTSLFPLTTCTFDDGVYVNGTPVTVWLNRDGYSPAKYIRDIQDNGYRTLIMYPSDFFLSQIYVLTLNASAHAVLLDSTVRANLTFANSGYDAINVTVEFQLDSAPIERRFFSLLKKGAIENLNVSWNATHGSQTLEAVLDVDGNASESDLLDNSATVEVFGVLPPNASLALSANRTYVGGSVTLNASGTVGDSQLEWQFDLGDGNVTSWQSESIFEHSYPDPGKYNLSVRAQTVLVMNASAETFKFISPWSYNVTLGVFEHMTPIASFTISPQLGNVTTTFHLNATLSHWFDVGLAKASDLRFRWTLDGVEFHNGTEPTVSLNFSDDTTYNITLTVIDPDNASSEPVLRVLTVQNLPPVAKMDLTPRILNVSLPYTLDVSAAQSSDPDDPVGAMAFSWGADNNTYSGMDQHIVFTKAGTYKVTLTVKDDDNATSVVSAVVVVNAVGGGGGGGQGYVLYIGIAVAVVILLAVALLCALLLIRNPEMLDRFTGHGLSVTDEHLKLETGKKEDFVIVKKGTKDIFKKYEVYKVTHQEDTYLCVAWTSKEDVEWQIIGTFTGPREEVLGRIKTHLDKDVGRHWSIDYWGNGKIVSGRSG